MDKDVYPQSPSFQNVSVRIIIPERQRCSSTEPLSPNNLSPTEDNQKEEFLIRKRFIAKLVIHEILRSKYFLCE